MVLPAPRYVDSESAVEALHGGANRRLQLVDVQTSVQGLQDIHGWTKNPGTARNIYMFGNQNSGTARHTYTWLETEIVELYVI